jgi:hypothetical protein
VLERRQVAGSRPSWQSVHSSVSRRAHETHLLGNPVRMRLSGAASDFPRISFGAVLQAPDSQLRKHGDPKQLATTIFASFRCIKFASHKNPFVTLVPMILTMFAHPCTSTRSFPIDLREDERNRLPHSLVSREHPLVDFLFAIKLCVRDLQLIPKPKRLQWSAFPCGQTVTEAILVSPWPT